MRTWTSGGALAASFLWLSCAATPDPPRPEPPQTTPPPACEVCEEGQGTCGCGPPPPVAPPQRCSDGTEEHVDVACLASAGTCGWRVTRSGCPEPCAPEACGPTEQVEALCPDRVTLKQRPLCLRAADGQCRFQLEEHSCTRVCDVDHPCPTDHFCSTAVGDCDGPGVCVIKPASCARTAPCAAASATRIRGRVLQRWPTNPSSTTAPATTSSTTCPHRVRRCAATKRSAVRLHQQHRRSDVRMGKRARPTCAASVETAAAFGALTNQRVRRRCRRRSQR
jgi:hypothetical protein